METILFENFICQLTADNTTARKEGADMTSDEVDIEDVAPTAMFY